MEAPISMTYDHLERILRPLVHQQLQDHRAPVADADVHVQDDDLAPVFSSLRKLIPSSDHGFQVPGIPLPEVDEQLGPLQQEVDSILQRLSNHRKEVPAVMAGALEQQLRELRPQLTPQKAAAEVETEVAADAEAEQLRQLAEAQKVHQAIKAAVNKLPALKARLEEMSMRLGRNLAAVDEMKAAATQPRRTVERVLRGVASGRNLDTSADEANPA